MQGTKTIYRRTRMPLMVIGTLVALALVAAISFWVFLISPASSAPPQQPMYSREEFDSRVMGKTRDEVYEAMGAPDFTSKDSESIYWHYRNRTYDPVSKHSDMDAQLVFHHEKVASVNY